MILLCLRLGFSLSDFRKLKVGTILDILITQSNQVIEAKENQQTKKENVREATSEDNIVDFF